VSVHRRQRWVSIVRKGCTHVKAEFGETLEVGAEVGGEGADDKVGLEADTVEEPFLLQGLGDGVEGIGLVVDALNVVIILCRRSLIVEK
jgi:hypothetical protein